jgi:hypothetical protein
VLIRKDSVAREEADKIGAVGIVAGGVAEAARGVVWECSGKVQSTRTSHGMMRKALSDGGYIRFCGDTSVCRP